MYPSVTRGLCSICRDINLNNLVPHIDPLDESLSSYSYAHHSTYTVLASSALSCPLCDLFLHALQVKNAGREVPEAYKGHELNSIWLICGDEVFFTLDSPKRVSQVRVNVGRGGVMQSADLSIFTDEDDPLAVSGDIIGRRIDRDMDPSSILNCMRVWYATCCDSHIECMSPNNKNKEDTQQLPTRVIDVGFNNSPTLSLVETKGLRGEYAALSYCWGLSQTFTTRQETYKSRIAGFKLHGLPLTIRDAVTVTRLLGLRFLWVDAICVIQGDAADWAIESSKMDEVYGNAAITISATGSPDTVTGCFLSPWKSSKPSVPLRCSSSDTGQMGTMWVAEKLGCIDEVLDRSVLNGRGWCLQERVLSRRIVHFAKDQVYWECQKHSNSEDGMVFNQPGAIKRCMYFPSTPSWAALMRSWHTIVTEYCLRDLSHPSDKLPALAGLATIVHRQTGATYLAGHWLEDLPFGLLWFVAEKDRTRAATTWRAPSWSWASMDGPVTSDGNRASALMMDPLEYCANIVSHSISLTTANPFGEVTGGSLILQTKISRARRHVMRRQVDHGGWTTSLTPAFPVVDEDGQDVGEATFDNSDQTPPMDFLCLLVCTGKIRSVGPLHYCVIVEHVEEGQAYRRIGSATLRKLRHAESIQVTLV